MLKYEEKLHLDKHYRELQSGSFIHMAISFLYGELQGMRCCIILFNMFLHKFRILSRGITWECF